MNNTGIDETKAIYKVPKLLHTCRSSRAATLPKYSLSFEDQLGNAVYFNYTTDTLQVEGHKALRYILRSPCFDELVAKFGLEGIVEVRFKAFGSPWFRDQERMTFHLRLSSGSRRMVFEIRGRSAE
jgi:hypothetical protein